MKIVDCKSFKEEEIIQEIITWVEQNRDPAYEENETLIRIQCIFCGLDVTKIKKFLDLYYKKRNELMTNYDRWDKFEENIRNAFDLAAVSLLPEKNPIGHAVIVMKLLDSSKDINFMDLQLRGLLVGETIKTDDLLGKKVIAVVDYTGVSFSFLFKLNIFEIQKVYKTWREYAMISCSEIHHINLTIHSYYVINLVNRILDDKLKKRNHYHTADLTEFHKQVPQEIMPKEYGGNAPEMRELSEHWYEEIMKHGGPAIKYFKSRSENMAKAKKQSGTPFYGIPFKLFGKLRKRNVLEPQH